MKKFTSFFIGALMFLFFLNSNSLADNNSLKILFTNDIHDHVEDFSILKDKKIINIGGYQRLLNKINEEKLEDNESIIVDAGDYSMGTLFQTIYGLENPSLKFLGEMGFEATTLGNHEFDYKSNELAASLNAAKDSMGPLPELLVSNLDLDLNKYSESKKKEIENLKSAFVNYGVKDYIILNKKGLKIGVFGLIGYNAISDSYMSGLKFKDPIKTASEITSTLKNKEKVDLIICLSHSGLSKNKSKSEDEILATKIKDLDIIISAHTHTEVFKPIIIGKTIIVSTGCYGENLGKLIIEKNDNLWKVNEYYLIKLNENTIDINIKNRINLYKDKIQKEYLDYFNLGFDEILGRSNFSLPHRNGFNVIRGEDALENLITDSYVQAVKNLEGENHKEISSSVVRHTTVRSSIVKGNITSSDVYNILPLGMGEDNIPGYPLIDIYLSGEELKMAAEFDASIQSTMDVAELYFSGLHYTFNPNRIFLNKVTDVYILDDEGVRKEIYDGKLYRVVLGLHTAQKLHLVKDSSHGVLHLSAKDELGNDITNLKDRILYNNGKEIKEWYALADYIKSFDKVNGIPLIPEEYKNNTERINIDNSKDIISIISNPSKIILLIYLFIFLFILIIFYIIKKFTKRRKKIK